MKSILVLCSLFLACVSSVTRASAQPERFVGKWYQGDGRGENITLTLKRDLTYEAVWTGCLGTYDAARGTWHLGKSALTLTPIGKKEMKLSRLRTLEVRCSKRGIVLVQPKNLQEFNQWGYEPPFPFWCFIRMK